MSAPRAAVLGVSGPVLLPQERDFLRAADPWGFILFARNVVDPDQVRALTADLREAVGRAAPVLIDQEGGRVQRLRAPHWREYRPALDQMARARDPLRGQWLRNRLIAAELAAVGIDVNCAPLADLVEEGTHPVLLNRLYGGDVATVTAAARAAADGLMAGGVLPVLKHVPGYGRARVDSHLALPRVTAPLAELRARDFAPFRALADLPMAMSAHIVVAALDPDRPATTSPLVMAEVRGWIGMDALMITDDLSMEALSGGIGARAAQALAAGCDIALHSNGRLAEMEEVIAASPALAGDSLRRAGRALAARKPAEPCDADALWRELQALLGDDAPPVARA
ncbi:MAG: glycoside hydrolase family 3 protein [Rubellimicrobium sp.]|nr:glycoside hydrolase family 3 protein [Rubellimicrobium sp.]